MPTVDPASGRTDRIAVEGALGPRESVRGTRDGAVATFSWRPPVPTMHALLRPGLIVREALEGTRPRLPIEQGRVEERAALDSAGIPIGSDDLTQLMLGAAGGT